MESKFLTTVGENVPVIMCENHAQMFEKIMMAKDIPHTIYEMDLDDSIEMPCQACDLHNELNKPRIILPGEF